MLGCRRGRAAALAMDDRHLRIDYGMRPPCPVRVDGCVAAAADPMVSYDDRPRVGRGARSPG